ncbi:TPA: polysaccharide pyruvyl transferase family protein [Enterococcus faecium]|nr:polysaccharide pyruvyl transferase family protein [Enterococcus faecium]RXE89039.1 polysaccharide pyruvyl transferase family protein [Enterococcus faecium]
MGYYFFSGLKKITTNERLFQKYEIRAFNWSKRKLFRDYYQEQLKNIDFLIVVGGALITYRFDRNFHSPLYELIMVAESLDKKVIFNSVGIENSYDLSYESCRMVKRYLNSKSVVAISTRDDFETLNRYLNDQHSKMIALTSDSAVFTNEIFKKYVVDKKYDLGIGLISPEKFNQYRDDNLSFEYISLVKSIINECIEKDINFCLFTNGHHKDYEFALSIIDEFNLPQNRILPRPESFYDLIEHISMFDRLVTSRLHSCIIAFSLNIPFVGIDWNGKLKFFSQIISREYFVGTPKEIQSSKDVFNKLDKFDPAYFSTSEVEEYKETEMKFLSKSLDIVQTS